MGQKSKVILGLALVFSVFSVCAKSSTSNSSEKLQTEMSFEDLLVKGKFHFSDEAVTTVEEDKVLDSLLGIRKNFKDRIKRSANNF